ncbi:hypothetical protein [Larkinella sp. VNQ87]|uniref:hypothetical protein n=1 Tax=Larkinella sp. VNQ87 TaxID=3400921 RepID=UPI003C2EDFC9
MRTCTADAARTERCCIRWSNSLPGHPEGGTLAPLCFLKGHAVSMVVVLINAETFPEAHQLVSNLHGIMGHFLYLQANARHTKR